MEPSVVEVIKTKRQFVNLSVAGLVSSYSARLSAPVYLTLLVNDSIKFAHLDIRMAFFLAIH